MAWGHMFMIVGSGYFNVSFCVLAATEIKTRVYDMYSYIVAVYIDQTPCCRVHMLQVKYKYAPMFTFAFEIRRKSFFSESLRLQLGDIFLCIVSQLHKKMTLSIMIDKKKKLIEVKKKIHFFD